jgi:tetratricopeptide (TPR) repeat protein
MQTVDRFELPVTAASAAAVADYVAAVDLLLSANTGADALLARALAADPDFALARIAHARLLQLQARIAEARATAERAEAAAVRCSSRERSHVAAIALAVKGDAGGALSAVRTHAEAFPRDALPLSLALGVFGLLGFSGRRDHHEAQLALLEQLAPQWPEDWWFLGYYGWAQIETGAIAAGTRRVERALALNPRNAHGAHQRAHGFFEAGDSKGGAAFIETWLPGYPRAGHLHCHLCWHLALFELAHGNSERALAVYQDAIRPGVALSAPMLSLADSASFLWRWRVYGVEPDLDDQWAEVADHARRHFPQAGLAFADVHAGLAEAATGDAAAVHERTDGLLALARARRLPPGGVAPALCAAVGAFAKGDYQAAAQGLEAALADLPRIGGSHAQREVFEDTLIVAALRSGRHDQAAAMLRSRLTRRLSDRDREWLRQCSAG